MTTKILQQDKFLRAEIQDFTSAGRFATEQIHLQIHDLQVNSVLFP